jgi:hypothetical protein
VSDTQGYYDAYRDAIALIRLRHHNDVQGLQDFAKGVPRGGWTPIVEALLDIARQEMVNNYGEDGIEPQLDRMLAMLLDQEAEGQTDIEPEEPQG